MDSFKQRLHNRAINYHANAPGLRKLPLSALAIIAALLILNAASWAGVGVILVVSLSLSWSVI